MDRVEFVPGQALPLFELKPPVFEGVDFAIKRTFDLVGAALLMVALSPLMTLAALAIKLSSRGPVFYRSMRPGIGGRPFACLKFRTMVAGRRAHAGSARGPQRGGRGDLQDARRTRA